MTVRDLNRPLDLHPLGMHPLGAYPLDMHPVGSPLLFRWEPHLHPAGEAFSRASVAKYSDSGLILQGAASGVLRNAHFQSDGRRSWRGEAARTNLLKRSEEMDHGDWGTLGGVLTITADDIVAPDSNTTADKVQRAASLDAYGRFQAFTYTAANYTLSCYAKAGTHSFFALDFTNANNAGAVFNLSTGAVTYEDAGITGRIASLPNGWYRCSISGTRTAVASFPEWYFVETATANIRSWAGAGTETMFLWGAQLELGAFPSSYIKTTTAAATRAADSLSYDFTHAPQAMTVYAKFVERGTAISPASLEGVVGIGSGVKPHLNIRTGSNDRYAMLNRNAAGDVLSQIGSGTPTLGSVYELTGQLYSDGAVQLHQSVDGGSIVSGAKSGAGTLSPAWSNTVLYLNARQGGANTGFADLIAVKVARGVQTMAAMRNA